MFARKVSMAMLELDPCINSTMRSKVRRLAFISELDEEVRDALPYEIQEGESTNPEEDNLFMHPANPMLRIVESFISRYIGSPWPGQGFKANDALLKFIVCGLSGTHLGILASRGFGKSVALALIAIIWCFFSSKGEDAFIVAPTSNQTDKVFDYICDFLKCGKNGYLMEGDPSIGYLGVESVRRGQKPVIRWRQGTIFRPACASRTNRGETMRGQQPTFEIIDESSYISDDIYYRTLKAGLGSVRGDHEVVIIESGTPDTKNHFYDLFNDKAKFGHYMTVRFDFEDGIRCNRYTPERIKELMAEAGGYDSEEFKSEYRCIFPSSVTNFFKNLDDVFSNEVVEWSPMPKVTYVAGLDLGRMIDNTVLTIGRYEIKDDGDYIDVVHIEELVQMEYPEQYEQICKVLKEWNVQQCVVDFTGAGIPIYESLTYTAAGNGVNTIFEKFVFSSTTKYPAYLNLRRHFANSPQTRIRYPDIKHQVIRAHPQWDLFNKAYNEFMDMIQKRTNSESDNNKYKIMPSKSRGHDDFVDSCICLSRLLHENFSGTIGMHNIKRKEDKDHPNYDAEKKKIVGRVGGRVRPGGGYRNSGRNWRQI